MTYVQILKIHKNHNLRKMEFFWFKKHKKTKGLKKAENPYSSIEIGRHL